MIPVAVCSIDYELPAHELWTPSPAERSGEEGFGGFRDTRPLGRVGVRHARAALEFEAGVIESVGHVATSPQDFDELLSAIGFDDREGLESEHLRALASLPDVSRWFNDDDAEPYPSGGLDIGVAGLVYALCTVGCFTAASCRGHVDKHAWSDFPMVRFAARRWRAALLIELAREVGCGFMYERDSLLTTWAPSVLETVAFGNLILDHRADFRKAPPGARRRRGPIDGQLRLAV